MFGYADCGSWELGNLGVWYITVLDFPGGADRRCHGGTAFPLNYWCFIALIKQE